MLKLAAALAALLLTISPAAAKKLEPVNDNAKDPELAAFLDTLVKAADAKDFGPFEKAISPEAIASFGGDTGVEGFKTVYGLPDPNSSFWAEFKEAVALGGVIDTNEDGTTYYAPYVFINWPEDLDSFEWVAAIGDKTMLHEKPDASSKTIADVTHEMMEVVQEDPGTTPEAWIHVKAEGKDGYVPTEQVRSPIDYRLVLQKTENRWWIGAFIAGD